MKADTTMHATTRESNSSSVRAGAALLAAALFIGVGTALAARTQEPEDQPAAAFKRTCSTCHDAERILANRRTRTQWEEVIEKMIDRGAEGTADDFSAAEVYLLRVSGRVNANRAEAQDFVAVLGLPQKDADAIVDFRKAKGDFADFDALCKVPGIDTEKLKQGRDAITY